MDPQYQDISTTRFDGDGLLADEERPTAELVKEAFSEARLLVKEELRLAKAEAKTEARKAARAGAGFGAGGVLLHLALFPFVACLVAIFDAFLPLWLAALVVTVLVAGAGGAAIFYGKKRLETLEPERTVRTFKEDKEWAKDTMQSIRSHRHGNA
jgi:hypothetical protein